MQNEAYQLNDMLRGLALTVVALARQINAPNASALEEEAAAIARLALELHQTGGYGTGTDAHGRLDAATSLLELSAKRIQELELEVSNLKSQMESLMFWKPLGGVGRGPVMNVCLRTNAAPEGDTRTLIFTYLSGATFRIHAVTAKRGKPRL